MSKPKLASEAHLQLSTMRADYNKHSRGQSQSLQMFKPFIDSAVAAHSSDLSGGSGPFMVADFGCSTGLNSSDAVSHVIGEVRKKYTWERCSSVLLVFNDLPGNPWSELFGFLHGDERSLLNQHRGVFAVSSGLTFYEQVLPDNSLQIGISNFCLHWCSQLPVKMKDHCFSMLASDEEREMFRQQGAKDWSSFLTARSKELVRGGVLAVNVLSLHNSLDTICDEVYQSAKALHTRGIIKPEELLNFNIRMCFRSLGDLNGRSQYESLGLELLRAEILPQTRSAYYEDFLQHGDAGRFALEYSSAISVVCEPSLRNALCPSRSEADREAICGELWLEYRARIVQQTEKCQYLWNSIGVVVAKC